MIIFLIGINLLILSVVVSMLSFNFHNYYMIIQNDFILSGHSVHCCILSMRRFDNKRPYSKPSEKSWVFCDEIIISIKSFFFFEKV